MTLEALLPIKRSPRLLAREELLSFGRAHYADSELQDIANERERELRRAPEFRRLPRLLPRLRTRYRLTPFVPMPIPGVMMGNARLAGAMGPLIMAQSAGLTIRGYYNPSVPAGVTVISGNISDLIDLHTSGHDYTQGTAGFRPAFTLNDGTLLGRATFTGDGTDDYLSCSTYSTPAPGTTVVYIRSVLKSVTYTTGDNIWNADATAIGCSMSQNPGPSPSIRMNNGSAANSNSGLAVGSWGRIEEQFQNTTADYLKAASTTVTGASAGNNSTGTGRTIFSQQTKANFSNVAMAFLMSCEGTAGAATSVFRTGADYWTTHYFGAGLV